MIKSAYLSLSKIFVLLSFLYSANMIGQNNSVNFEVLGHSQTIIAINYERFFKIENEKLLYSIKIGVGRNPASEADQQSTNKRPAVNSLPFVGNLMYQVKNYHYLNIGTGYTMFFSENYVDTTLTPNIIYKDFFSNYSISLGYRYFGNSINVYLYPILILNDINYSSKFGFGVSLGYAF